MSSNNTEENKNGKISVMLLSKYEDKLTQMRNLIHDENINVVYETADEKHAIDNVEALSPNIIIIAINGGDTTLIGLADRIITYKPRTYVILLVENKTEDIMSKALNIGAHNLAEMPATQEDMSKYIKSVYEKENTRLSAIDDKNRMAQQSHVISVYGVKDGLGRTTIATNLAIELATRGKKVALVDLDLQFGDIGTYMNIETKNTIAELVQESSLANIDDVRSYMSVHSSGVSVLCAPNSPEYAEVVSAEKVEQLITLIRSYYDYVIIDTSSAFTDITTTALDLSSSILFVVGLDVSILKNTKLAIGVMNTLNLGSRIKIVINRYSDSTAVTLSDVQDLTGSLIWEQLPNDYPTAVLAVNRGVPFIIGNPNGKLSLAIYNIADTIIEDKKDFDLQKLSPKERKRRMIEQTKLLKKRNKKISTIKFSLF